MNFKYKSSITKSLIFVLLLSSQCYFVAAQTYNLVKPKTQKVIDSTYQKLLKQYEAIGFSIAIVDSGKIVYSKGYGFSDLQNKVAANDNTIYRIGSVSKSFTALSIMQLNEKGKINLDAGLKTYLPNFGLMNRFNDENSFKINDVMTHTSGLPSDMLNGFFCTNPPEIQWVINNLKHSYPISKANYKHAYSNIGYGMLGQVIANVSNTSYSNYVKQNIFAPLKMNSSYIDVDTALSKKFSKGYLGKKETYEPLIRDAAAGLIHSNVLDMANYIKMFLAYGKFDNTEIASKKSIDEMEANHVKEALLNKNDNWGYGLYTKNYINEKDSSKIKVTGHGGDTYLYHADMVFSHSLNVGAVILTNSDNGASLRDADKLLVAYLKEEKGIKIKAQSADTSLKQNNEVAFNNNDVMGNYFMNNILIKVDNTEKFSAKQGPATLVFKERKDKKYRYKLNALILGIIPIKIKGQEFEFAKVDGQMYMKGIQTKRKSFSYLATKTEIKSIPTEWDKVLGKYEITENKFKCDDCPFGNFKDIKMKLSKKNGNLFFELKPKNKSEHSETILLPIDGKSAVTPGIGRGTGETILVLENGNIYYNGFEFKKMK